MPVSVRNPLPLSRLLQFPHPSIWGLALITWMCSAVLKPQNQLHMEVCFRAWVSSTLL